ncbi:type IV toxin-antitoxin system AbiEi family antitoxin domain-containing protein [Micromonospora sp. NPDC049679]|uniref:type IV toxin-antitoxin system AbiEi family antitoxin domain-containing protein n=1 Tax=Micromonospora sp. NPDC049679 TaxID=3155920 RepID=UPI0033CF9591
MSDLYDDAAAVPRLLQGRQSARRYGELRRQGISRQRLSWAHRRGRLLRPFHNAYLLGSGGGDLIDTLNAALLVLPPAAVIARHTAAALYGFGVVPADSVHVAVPAGTPVPQRRGVVAHESVLPFEELIEVFGIPCLPPARCAIELARQLSRPDALAVLDAALRSGTCGPEQLLVEVGRHDRLRGVCQARELVPLATPLPECRQESHLRLLLHDGRLPAPQPQLAVVDEWGVKRHRFDLGYEDQRVGIEYDGSSHLDRARMRHDRRRHNWLAARGWRMRYFTDEDLYRWPERLVHTVRSTLTPRSRSSSPIKDKFT